MASKTSEIKFTIELGEKNIPEKIKWLATDSTNKEYKESKSIIISIWDKQEQNSYNINLWTKDMRIDEMNIHFIQTLMMMAESFQKATGNTFVVEEMKKFCDNLIEQTVKSGEKKET